MELVETVSNNRGRATDKKCKGEATENEICSAFSWPVVLDQLPKTRGEIGEVTVMTITGQSSRRFPRPVFASFYQVHQRSAKLSAAKALARCRRGYAYLNGGQNLGLANTLLAVSPFMAFIGHMLFCYHSKRLRRFPMRQKALHDQSTKSKGWRPNIFILQ